MCSGCPQLPCNRAGKKPINKKTHKQNFHGIAGTVPGLSRPFPEISWEFCLCVSLFLFMCFPFSQEKGKHINNLTPTHFRDNPAKLFMFIGFFLPRYKKSVSVHPVHGNPRTGLLRTFSKPHRVLRSPFRGLCVQGAQHFPPI